MSTASFPSSVCTVAPWLSAYPQFGVIVCSEHQCAFIPGKNLENHLVHPHSLEVKLRREVSHWATGLSISRQITCPPSHSSPIPGLAIVSGFVCRIGSCEFASKNRKTLERHASSSHGLKTKLSQSQSGAITPALLQHWRCKTSQYWPVCQRSLNNTIVPHQTPESTASPGSTPPLLSLSNALSDMFQYTQRSTLPSGRTLLPAEHTAELTPWLRQSGFHDHIQPLILEDVTASLLLPKTFTDHSVLWLILRSVHRVLLAAYNMVSDLHHIDAQWLNSGQDTVMSQDPFKMHQQWATFTTYVTTWKHMVSYFYQASTLSVFDECPFRVTDTQAICFKRVEGCAGELLSCLRAYNSGSLASLNIDVALEEPEVEPLQENLDQAIHDFHVSLIQHRIVDKEMSSNALLSFTAVWAWKGSKWASENDCSSMFSAMIYCCQLVMLREAHSLAAGTDFNSIGDAIEHIHHRWLNNQTRGPFSSLLRLRLLAKAIAMHTVNPASIRWKAHGDTLIYKDIEYQISDLAKETRFYLDEAQSVLFRDLLFDFSNVPVFDIGSFRDDWSDLSENASFITNPHNADTLGDNQTWLLRQIGRSPTVWRRLIANADDALTDWTNVQLRATFAREYEDSVQCFLGLLSILMHKTSGQPARRTEYMSLRWRNKLGTIRNLFVHDGYLLFVLTYHKTLHKTHASRSPVRFLLPAVGQLVIQFLVLVMPLRQVLSRFTAIPQKISSYLWHDGTQIWKTDFFSDLTARYSQMALGMRINIQSWRQIAVAIAIRRFANYGIKTDLDLVGDHDDDALVTAISDDLGGAMGGVFHLQAAHSVFTGNKHYGRTIDFSNGLTDAALSEYFRASSLWHSLCLLPNDTELLHSLGTQGAATAPALSHVSLYQRLVYRQRPRQYTYQPTQSDIVYALRRIYPMVSHPRFRSKGQYHLVQAVVSRTPEVCGILATGAGKSLAFLLPCLLPDAIITVGIIPLVALRADLIRRCTEAHIAFRVWNQESDFSAYHQCNLVLVSMEQAISVAFKSFLLRLQAQQRLDRIVFDEAHLALQVTSYRHKFIQAKTLRQFTCQMVFLTGTLPPIYQAQFEQRFLLHNTRYVRTRTFRSDIRLRIIACKADDLLTFIGTHLRREVVQLSPDDRIIVYVQRRADADKLSELLGCVKYYSDSDDAAGKEEVIARWRTGESSILVATSAFGLGVDCSTVRLIVHAGAPEDMISFAQEIGRGGRDGNGCSSRVVLPRDYVSSQVVHLRDQRYLLSTSLAMGVYLGQCRCLSAVLSRFLDGIDQMQYCSASSECCTHCKRKGLFNPSHDKDVTDYWDLHAGTGTIADLSESLSESDGDQISITPSTAVTLPFKEPTGGRERLRADIRGTALGRARFEQLLRLFSGSCMICMILERSSGQRSSFDHPLSVCQSDYRTKFFTGKKRVLSRYGNRGWIPKFTACFKCYLPQSICDSFQTQQICKFPDMVLPAAWAVFHCSNLWGQSLQAFAGVPGSVTSSEDSWMDWLAKECDLYNMRACQMARILDRVMTTESVG